MTTGDLMEEQAIDLPPLPEHSLRQQAYSPFMPERLYWTADQMQAYARAAVLAERERCARVCDAEAVRHGDDDEWASGRKAGAESCASAIRSGLPSSPATCAPTAEKWAEGQVICDSTDPLHWWKLEDGKWVEHRGVPPAT